jgi:peptidyl-tRNA hydrolase
MNEDPLVLYLIVRKDLNMSAGKIGAQIGHAVERTVLFYQYTEDSNNKKIFSDYRKNGSRKIVLTASDSKWEKLKEEVKDINFIKDCGLTEVPSGTETVAFIPIMKKSQVPSLFKKLQALK